MAPWRLQEGSGRLWEAPGKHQDSFGRLQEAQGDSREALESSKEAPGKLQGAATSNGGERRDRDASADAVPGSPGRQYQKTNIQTDQQIEDLSRFGPVAQRSFDTRIF